MLRPYKKNSFRCVRDQEFEGAGDDTEFDGEAGERLAVDLRINRILIERLAENGVGLEEFDAFGAAKLSHPKSGQVAEIAEATLCGQSHDFKLVGVEISLVGDFEWSAVVLRAADDDQGRVDLVFAADDAKVREFVAEGFAGTFPPVREDADASFEAEIDGINDHAVGASASDA